MGENSKIEWTHHTFNPWVGCTKVSPGCTHCYAEALSKRTGLAVWGDNGTRRVTSDAYWKQPAKWAREAEAAGERRRVFCASLADVLEDRRDLDDPRNRLWDVIDTTKNILDWLLLTKRPENFEMIPNDLSEFIWKGVSTEDQDSADKRIPLLLQTPAVVRFLSAEPLLGPLCLGRFLHGHEDHGVDLSRPVGSKVGCCVGYTPPLDWVIVGGESGPGARPCRVEWIESIVAQCSAADVDCFVKQLGAYPVWAGAKSSPVEPARGKNADIGYWPNELRIQEYPRLVA